MDVWDRVCLAPAPPRAPSFATASSLPVLWWRPRSLRPRVPGVPSLSIPDPGTHATAPPSPPLLRVAGTSLPSAVPRRHGTCRERAADTSLCQISCSTPPISLPAKLIPTHAYSRRKSGRSRLESPVTDNFVFS